MTEKVKEEWRKEKSVQNLDHPIELGRANIKIDCPAFGDDNAILIRAIQITQKAVELLKETAKEVGLF